MSNNEQLVNGLSQRGITPLDLADIILTLKQDTHSAATLGATEEEQERTAVQVARETDELTAAGLAAQVEWMASYYENLENLNWALAGYLNLPMAA